MDDFKKRIFDKIWGDFIRDFSENDQFVDRLYQDGLVDRFKYEEIKMKRGTDLLNSIYNILISSKDGYDAFKKELFKNHLDHYDTAKKLEDYEFKKEVFTDALIFGDVPRPPQYYIERTQLLQDVRQKLGELNPSRSNKMILYGMNGIGKSCLAAAAIRDIDLLLNSFNNKVFWIKVGKVDDQQLFDLMYRLYRKIILRDQQLKNVLPLDKPSNLEEMQDNLLLLFRKDSYKNALIVLDNVNSAEVVKSFDKGCNLMVISQEKISINREKIIYIPVQDGFSEEESLKIFANSLEAKYEDIRYINGPGQIHSWCKGHPMLISLWAALLEERKVKLINNPSQWLDLFHSLSKKKMVTNKLYATINLCFDDLDPDLQTKYLDFAIFVYDINITPEVLMILWGLERIEVEEVMKKLQKKCLIVSGYNQYLKTDVYGIHHVFIDFLKSKLKEDTIINLHKKLIMAYKDACNNDYSALPNDNYIYQYLGYHFSEARMYEEFSIYFDLDFVGAKIKATGIADLLRDYNIHKEHIVKKDDTLQEKLMHYIKFVEMFGQNLYEYQYTDIIQSGLQLSKDNPVYKAAYKIAKDRSDYRLYFKMHAPHESNFYTHILTLNVTFNAARFTGETNKIIIGTESGNIELWERQYMKKLQTYMGHSGSITYLRLNESKDKFLSISRDGSVKIWNLSNVEYYKPVHIDVFEKPTYYEHLDSPSSKQTRHQTFFGSDENIIDYCDTLYLEDDKIVSAAFSNDYEKNRKIVTGTKSGKIVIWKDNKIFKEIPPMVTNSTPIECVAFSNDDALVIVSIFSDLFIYDSENGEFLSKFCNKLKSRINAIHVIPDSCSVITVQDNCILHCIWEQKTFIKEHNGPKIAIKNFFHYIITTNEEYKIICSTIAERFLIVGSSDSRIRMWHIDSLKMIQDFFDHNGQIMCMDACLDERDNSIYIVLTGSEAQIVKMWHVQAHLGEMKPVMNLPFASHFSSNETINRSPLIALPNTDKKIQILRGHNLLVETEQFDYQVTTITFNSNGNNIFYGLENGDVYMYRIKNKENKKIMQLSDPITYLEAISIKGKNYEVLELIVAATDTGKFYICENDEVKMLIGFIDNSKIPIVPILKCFYIKSADQLLTVSKKKIIIKSWDLETLDRKVLYSDSSDNDVSSTCISHDESLLCITTNCLLQVFNINIESGVISIDHSQGKELEDSLKCCCFSFDNSYLALGCQNGNIVIWDLMKTRIFTTFVLHNSPVRYLQFAPSNFILISVAEQIVWWNVGTAPDESTYRSRSNSTHLSSRRQSSKRESNEFLKAMSLINCGISWSNKTGCKNKHHILSAIKFHGVFANHVTFSRDFDIFLTVDNQGEIYIMEVLDDS